MSTTPVTPTVTAPNWITLLVTLGANLGASFIKNTQIGALIELAASTTNTVIAAVQAAHAGNTSVLTVPLFVGILTDALSGAVIAGKITAAEAAELSKALLALSTEDAAAKAAVDYSTLGPIQPLP